MKYIAIVNSGNLVAGVVALPDEAEPDSSGYGITDDVAATVDVTSLSPRPSLGWTYNGATFTPPDPGSLPLPVQAVMLLGNGLTVQSTSTPSIDSIYVTDGAAQERIALEITYLIENNFSAFLGGATTIDWPDGGGVYHTFDITLFRAFARAHAAFIRACQAVIAGQSTTLPSNSVTLD
jgi:hypothetical protein